MRFSLQSKLPTLALLPILGFLVMSCSASFADPSSQSLKLVSDFDDKTLGDLDDRYICKQKIEYVPRSAADSTNLALKINLDPKIERGMDTCADLRAELAEHKADRLPIKTEVWYGFDFLIPEKMKGKVGYTRFVLAQIKQRNESNCRSMEAGTNSVNPENPDNTNPVVSVRLLEDIEERLVALQLTVSSQNVNKIPVGFIMRRSENFFGQWRRLIIHAYIDPRLEGYPKNPLSKSGYVEAFLVENGQVHAFPGGTYGKREGKVTWDQPFGYPGFLGCQYFKFGLYADAEEAPWIMLVDRFRRGASREDVE